MKGAQCIHRIQHNTCGLLGHFRKSSILQCSAVLPSRNLLFCLNRNEEFCCVLYNTIHVTSKCACHGFVTWSKLLQSIKIIGNKSVVTGNQSKSQMRIVTINFRWLLSVSINGCGFQDSRQLTLHLYMPSLTCSTIIQSLPFHYG